MRGFITSVVATFLAFGMSTRPGWAAERIWAHDNLFAWSVSSFDTVERTPEERVAMVKELGFGGYAMSGGPTDAAGLDREIAALKKNSVKLVGWSFSPDLTSPSAQVGLQAIKRHHLHPWLIVMLPPQSQPHSAQEWAQYLPAGMKVPTGKDYYNTWSERDKASFRAGLMKVYAKDLTKTPEEQKARVETATRQIKAIADVAAACGCRVALYNHNGWFGMIENQLAIIDRLKTMGVTNVGIMYNFHHARDELHDDSQNFRALWEKMKPHVVAITVSGLKPSDGSVVFPSQGGGELEMMRTIEKSGWKGWVGLNAENGGPADLTLKNSMIGLDWLAAELQKPGSGGPRPFPSAR